MCNLSMLHTILKAAKIICFVSEVKRIYLCPCFGNNIDGFQKVLAIHFITTHSYTLSQGKGKSSCFVIRFFSTCKMDL